MVEKFIVTAKNFVAGVELKKACLNLPQAMSFTIISENPVKVEVFPVEDRVKLAMLQDKKETSSKNYMNILTPFLRAYVRQLKYLEIKIE